VDAADDALADEIAQRLTDAVSAAG
jgi:hypothetical protein